MAIAVPPGLITFRPTRKNLPRTLFALGLESVIGLIALIFGVVSREARPLAVGIAFIALVVIGALWLVVWRRNAGLIAGPGWIGSSNFFGRRRYWSAAEVTRILVVPMIYARTTPAPRIRVIFLTTGDKRILTINPIAWDDGVLEELYRAVGRNPDVRKEAVTAKELKAQMPDALMWSEKHIALLGFLAGAIVLAVILVSFAVASALLAGTL